MVPGRELSNCVAVRLADPWVDVYVDWDGQKVTLQSGSGTVTLTIGSPEALVDGKRVNLDVPAALVPPGRLFVPLRFVAESLGFGVEWKEGTVELRLMRINPSSRGKLEA
ncbi:copper amine oxidase N-terminal domain-containing protein [Ammonifex thiophilus]|uniref:copper amine oxidase N-terminal domain-containing protein n=1 Tax=Ammonifex thiophilus TaxID=444093 RepID=UPI001F0C524F|nr:copper amine oxidase N-terminal domain-containing protein [Ammonifex thiophilus]